MPQKTPSMHNSHIWIPSFTLPQLRVFQIPHFIFFFTFQKLQNNKEEEKPDRGRKNTDKKHRNKCRRNWRSRGSKIVFEKQNISWSWRAKRSENQADETWSTCTQKGVFSFFFHSFFVLFFVLFSLFFLSFAIYVFLAFSISVILLYDHPL